MLLSQGRNSQSSVVGSGERMILHEPRQTHPIWDAAEAAIRAAEDQLVAAIKAQEARDPLYAKRDQLRLTIMPGGQDVRRGSPSLPISRASTLRISEVHWRASGCL